MEIKNLFNKPQVVGVIGDINQGKSNFIYYLINSLKTNFKFNLYTYGLKFEVDSININSIKELEKIKNSLIIIDEFYNLFDLEDRKKRKLIEKSLRLISHNNNILVLVGLPENFKKFISAKLNLFIFHKSTIEDFINGSKVKSICLDYKGEELGSSVLNLNINEILIFEEHYFKMNIPYLIKFDSKKNNPQIFKKV